MRIPHLFRAYGKTWRVRWWEESQGTSGFNPQLHHAFVDEGSRTITMHPALKGRPRQAFEAFVHEILHIVNFEEPKRSGRSRFRLRHDLIHHLDEPLAFALMSMGVSFRCVCRRCEPASRSRFSSADPVSLSVAASGGNGSCRTGARGRGMSPRPGQEDIMAQGGRGRSSSGGGRGKSSRGSSSGSSSSSSRGRGQSNRGRSSSSSRKRSGSRSGGGSSSSSSR